MNTRGITDRLQTLQKRAGESARNMSQVTDHYVRDNTWTSVAVAAILGCVVGLLLARGRGED